MDLRRGILLCDGTERPLRPKPTAFLRYLVEHGGQLVSRDEIAQAIWPGVGVSDESMDQCVRSVRKALGDDVRQTLRTVPKREYLLVAEVTRYSSPVALAMASGMGGDRPAIPLPSKYAVPSIAVLPFQNLSGDPDNDYFVDGFVEEIITTLSSVPSLFVVASASSFSYRQQAVQGGEAGRDLGVRYVLAGCGNSILKSVEI